MRIAQVAPLHEAVPPRLYGGTERIVSYLTEGLVARGHEVTLFASGASRTTARLAVARPQALRLDPGLQSETAAHLAMLANVRRRAHEFDVIHVHLSHFLHFPVLSGLEAKTVTTPHGRLDYADLAPALTNWPDFPFISISFRQRAPLRAARWIGNVYHGLPLELYPPASPREDRYLAFLGRISPQKRPDRAIHIARRAGMKLKIAAKVDGPDEQYFREVIEPLLDVDIEFIGEVDESGKGKFFSGAAALLFPVDWPEPFGLVAIEAMAFGVPVIAWREGAMPEVVDHGETGFLVDTVEEAVEAVARCVDLRSETIRQVFERRFAADRMVSDYEAIYARMIQDSGLPTHIEERSSLGAARERTDAAFAAPR